MFAEWRFRSFINGSLYACISEAIYMLQHGIPLITARELWGNTSVKFNTLSYRSANLAFHFRFCSTTEGQDLESACTSFVGATVFELAAVRTLVIDGACLHGGTQGFLLYVWTVHLQVKIVLCVWCMYVCTYIAHTR